ncbi:MAG: Rieske 2Fe-2S domain-containing protein [Acidimicrobiia bacterium]|nr:Rieske 2Fe-2S domain-containing protein [Acidimicrobiia bacterium]
MIIAIAIAAAVVLVALLAFAASRRRDTDAAVGALSRETRRRDRSEVTAGEPVAVGAELRGRQYERSVALDRIDAGSLEPVTSAPPVAYVPPDAETLGVTRRQFLNRSIVGFMVFSLSGFGAAMIAFLWPTPKGGFGAEITVGNVDDVKAEIRANEGFFYVPEGRMWVTEYPAGALPKAEAVYSASVLAGMEQAGLVALWQTCPHLGCRVPNCATSQWFECPCHGSQYNRVGEKRGGPAPRGMDRFAASVDGAGNYVVDTGNMFQGPPIGTNTTGQEAEGPHCIGQAGSHA